MNGASKYDLVVKDLFQRDRPRLLDRLTGGVAVRQVLNVELAKVLERRADLVLLVEDGTILHIEFQSFNAMLANDGPAQMMEIAKRAAALKGAERERVLNHLVMLSGLRQLTGRLKIDLQAMGIATDPFYRHPLVRDAIRGDRAKMLRDQLKTKFGTLPKWVDERLEEASSAQIGRWSKKILTAGTLEGVLGKK